MLVSRSSAYLLRSRGVGGRVLPSLPEGKGTWLAAIADLARVGDGVLLPMSDAATDFLVAHRGLLPERLASFETSASPHLELMDKARLYEISRELGVRTPWTITVRCLADLEASLGRIAYPCVLKPVHSHLWRSVFGEERVILLDGPEQLHPQAERALEAGLEILISEYVPGPENLVENTPVLRAGDGSYPLAFGVRKLRQYPVGFGMGSLIVTAPTPDSERMARTILAKTDFVGFSEVETKRHPETGDLVLIELNVRATQCIGLGQAAGVDAAWRLYATLAGLPLPPQPSPRDGVKTLVPLLDARAVRTRRRRGELSWRQLLASYRGVRDLGILDLRDSGPLRELVAGKLAARTIVGHRHAFRPPEGGDSGRSRIGDQPIELSGLDAFTSIRTEWNALAYHGGSPFLTYEWLRSWWEAFGSGTMTLLVLRDDGGAVRAGAFCRRKGPRLTSTANPESGDWDVVAADDSARRDIWRYVLERAPRSLVLTHLLEDSPSHRVVASELRRAGYLAAWDRGPFSPCRRLPGTTEELRAGLSRNLRSQIGRRRRTLEKTGRLEIRTTQRGGPDLEEDLKAAFAVEGSGWKGRAGTAILSDPRTEMLYRRFAHLASAQGWLRLRLMRLDGEPIALDFGCSYAGRGFLLKTGFDERFGRLSPGLVLQSAVLEECIEEGLAEYDFLGGPDPYKLRWTDEVRARLTLRAYRGPSAPAPYLWHAGVRPILRGLRDRARERRATPPPQQPG